MSITYENCRLCPRGCGVDRTKGQKGFCLASDRIFVAKAMLHKYEEPPVSGKNGAGAVFFSCCVLRCVFCQNAAVSRNERGKICSVTELAELFLSLQEEGAETLDLVTPTHYAPGVAEALIRVKDRLRIPVVYNCGGYESVETLKAFEGLVDVYLPDVKYYSPELSASLSSCGDYFEKALAAVREMKRQTGGYGEKDGIACKGTVIRHLVLPGHRNDSIALLGALAEEVGVDGVRLSLMSQYTPFYGGEEHPELKRRLTSFEYTSVLDRARELGFCGFCQDRSSAVADYTPDF